MSIDTNNKTISIEVPEACVAEFYAWYARFLAAPERRRRRSRHGRGRCGRSQTEAGSTGEAAAPAQG
ncbi:MAG: hypothetical protein ACR2ND_08820 [Solirubrobacteraceae bacterium]